MNGLRMAQNEYDAVKASFAASISKVISYTIGELKEMDDNCDDIEVRRLSGKLQGLLEANDVLRECGISEVLAYLVG